MVVNLNAIQAIHEQLTYTDKCTVFAYKEAEDDDGAVATVKNEIPVYEDVPCHLSFSLRVMENFDKTYKDKTRYSKQPKLFINNKYSIPEGSYIVAQKLNTQQQVVAIYKGQCSIASMCTTHQEFLIDVKEDA